MKDIEQKLQYVTINHIIGIILSIQPPIKWILTINLILKIYENNLNIRSSDAHDNDSNLINWCLKYLTSIYKMKYTIVISLFLS